MAYWRRRCTYKGKILVLHGADDPVVPDDQTLAFWTEMRDAKANWQFVAYRKALHTFTNWLMPEDGPPPAAYNKQADQRSWIAMQDFSKRFLNEKADARAVGVKLVGADANRGRRNALRSADCRPRVDVAAYSEPTAKVVLVIRLLTGCFGVPDRMLWWVRDVLVSDIRTLPIATRKCCEKIPYPAQSIGSANRWPDKSR